MRDARSHRPLLRRARLCLGASFSAALSSVAIAGPPNDRFADAAAVPALGSIVVTTNNDATLEPGEPMHAGSPGGHSLWWSWTSPFTGSVSVSTAGSSFDTLLAVYTGDTVTNLELVADNDDAGGFGDVTSHVVFRAIEGESYHVAVDGFNDATGTVQLAVDYAGHPAPRWIAEDLHGETLTSSGFSDRVLVIDFWETTCGACVDELPYLKQIYTNFVSEGLSFLGFCMDPPGTDISPFVAQHEIPYPIARGDPDIDAAFGGNVPFPTKFLIDREGKLVGQYSVGNADYAYYARVIKPLLRGSKKVALAIRRSANAFVFAWPGTEWGYDLESANDLASTNWTVAPYSQVTTNHEHTIAVPVNASAQFFRLRKTPAPQ